MARVKAEWPGSRQNGQGQVWMAGVESGWPRLSQDSWGQIGMARVELHSNQ